MIRFEHSTELVYAGEGGGSNRHREKIWFQTNETDFVLFEGVSIPGVVRVENSAHTKNGKWSYTAYRLAVADGVVAWRVVGGYLWRADKPEAKLRLLSLTCWDEVDATGIDRSVIRAVAKKTTARLDENEQPI